ncbi:MAG TPA: SDR family oxidoreductase [Coriobacteriia bacterium]|jgi:NADP-dependent 3-hydroxy acid dehydrogenase YdfG
MEELTGRIAMVTGGARGLGAEICNALAKAGCTVISADRTYDVSREIKAGRAYEGGGQIVEMGLDISDAGQAADAVKRVADTYGVLDILVNNAGVDVTKPIAELDIAEWDRVMAVNLRAPFVLSRAALAKMKENGSGQIVNICSTAAKRAWPNAAVYHASKWGLLGFTHALHVEARQLGVKVTALVSGGMRTPFLTERFPDIDQTTLQDPANVAEVVRFVLSLPAETVIPEVMVIPMRETSWP